MKIKLSVLFNGQVPKEPAFPEANEDYFVISPDDGRVALCDGASESFDSKSWANILANSFVENPSLDPKWLLSAIIRYKSNFDVSNMSWSKQAAFERGSFSTLLGIELNQENGDVDVLSVGDSIAVFLSNEKYVSSFPYRKYEDFKQRPNLFSTNPQLNGFIDVRGFFGHHLRTWKLNGKDNPIILCMTDALGEWALRNHNEGTPVWSCLSNMRELSDFEELILTKRTEKEMRVDDASLIVLSFTSDIIDELSIS